MNQLVSGTNEVKVAALGSDDVTLVIAVLDEGIGITDGVGSAKRSPDDPFDPIVGGQIATGRALIDLGEKLVKQGHKRSHELRREADAAAIKEANDILYEIEVERELRKQAERAAARANHPTAHAFGDVKRVSRPRRFARNVFGF
jgi:hypothetical protein